MNKIAYWPLFRSACVASAYTIDIIAAPLPSIAGIADMSTVVVHRKVNIVVLEHSEDIAGHCRAGDIAIVPNQAGWWTKFVGEGGQVESYDIPYASYKEALWAAKAAAEFGL